jgi:3-methylfumaryl-CoA hydratase
MQPAALDVTEWVGRTETVHDALAPAQALAVAAMFDDPNLTARVGDAIPMLWQWFYFLPRAPQSQLSVDGHPERGGFMPPITLPRRMFAGARVRVHQPLRLGVPAERQAVIHDVAQKAGRSGDLVFVTVQYRFVQAGVLCLEEEQDIVYREPGAPVSPPAVRPWPDAPPRAVTAVVHLDTRLLFRFSALTFNAHRIHYDREYAMRDEGYPGLVVHGPLTAHLLLRLAERQERERAREAGRAVRTATSFAFRGLAPLFDTAPFRLQCVRDGDQALLEAHGPDGSTALSADVRFADARFADVP